ncbi:hypothetical protein [Castellaniella caeni]|uniref:hypothetical protein n=1 Tax=Castellaniella caeni TaxID=266123 RepID=UPI0011AF1CB5|nr:hypothetical protein [Castellaniella caeni]
MNNQFDHKLKTSPPERGRIDRTFCVLGATPQANTIISPAYLLLLIIKKTGSPAYCAESPVPDGRSGSAMLYFKTGAIATLGVEAVFIHALGPTSSWEVERAELKREQGRINMFIVYDSRIGQYLADDA